MSENITNLNFLIKWLPLLCIFIDFLFPPPLHDGEWRARRTNGCEKLKNRVFHKNMFFHYFKWNWGGLGVSRVTARTVRTHKHNFSRDLVLHGIRKSTFRKYWNFNVLEMAFKTLHFVPGLSRTPLLFIPRFLTNIFFRNYFPTKTKLKLKI